MCPASPLIVWLVYKLGSDASADYLYMELGRCSEEGDMACVKEQLSYGADPNFTGNHSDGKPLTRARQAGHQDIVDLLKRYGAKE